MVHYALSADILLVSVNHLRPKFKPIVCYQISTPYSLTGRLTLYGLKKVNYLGLNLVRKGSD